LQSGLPVATCRRLEQWCDLTKIAPLDVALKSVLVIQAATPAAIFPIDVTRAHHGDMPTALQVVLGTSLIAKSVALHAKPAIAIASSLCKN
jgi:hypothetical protein